MIATLCVAMLLSDNTAIVPVSKMNEEWWRTRHEAVLALVKNGEKHELALIGDSITHGWGGQPEPSPGKKGVSPKGFELLFGEYHPVNMGFSGDQTQHVLWRLDNGELDGMNPKVCMVMIGTNNMGSNSVPEIAEGVKAVVMKIHEKAPKSKVLLCSILPREWAVGDWRKKVAATNELLAAEKWPDWVDYVPCWDEFLNEDDRMIEALMPDQLHPSESGYEVWGDILRPHLKKLFAK